MFIKRAFQCSVMALLFCISNPAVCRPESIKDGILMRERGPVILKDGSRVECDKFWWFVETADFIQCDKGTRSVELPLSNVNIGRTFSPEIEKEYLESKKTLKEEYEESKKERKENIEEVESKAVIEDKKAGSGGSGLREDAGRKPRASGSQPTASGPGKAPGTDPGTMTDKEICLRRLEGFREKAKDYCRRAEEQRKKMAEPPKTGTKGKYGTKMDAVQAKRHAEDIYRLDDLTARCGYYEGLVREYELRCR